MGKMPETVKRKESEEGKGNFSFPKARSRRLEITRDEKIATSEICEYPLNGQSESKLPVTLNVHRAARINIRTL